MGICRGRAGKGALPLHNVLMAITSSPERKRRNNSRLRMESLEDRSLLASATFQQGIAGYAGTEDTFLKQGDPDANNAAEIELSIDGLSGGGEVHGLLRFDSIVGGGFGQVPAGVPIISATLELEVTNRGHSMQLHRMLRSWNDTDTWNTLTAGIQADDVEAVSIADVATGTGSVGLLTIDVTTSLEAWVGGAGSNQGWAFLPTGNNGVEFYSAEGLTPPRLIVEFGDGVPNNAPVADDDTYSVDEDTVLNVPPNGVLGN